MFHLGWQELLVVAFIAFLLIGPKDMPSALRAFVRFTSWTRSASARFHNWMDAFARDFELDRLKRDIHQDLEPPTGLANLKTNLKTKLFEPGLGEKTGPRAKAGPTPGEATTETTADSRVSSSVHEGPQSMTQATTPDGIQGVIRGPTEPHGTAQTEAGALKQHEEQHEGALDSSGFSDSPASSNLLSSVFPDNAGAAELLPATPDAGALAPEWRPNAEPYIPENIRNEPAETPADSRVSSSVHEEPQSMTRDITPDGIQGVVRGPTEPHGTAQTEAGVLKQHEGALDSSGFSDFPVFSDSSGVFPDNAGAAELLPAVPAGQESASVAAPGVGVLASEWISPAESYISENIRNETGEATASSQESSSETPAPPPGIKGVKP